MKNFEQYVIVLLLVILGLMAFMAYRQHEQVSKIEKAEKQIDDMYNTFEKWVPMFDKIAKMFSGGV